VRGIRGAPARLASQTAGRLGIGPDLVAVDDDALVTAFIETVPLQAQRLRHEAAAVGRALREFHDSGLTLPVRFWVPDQLDDFAEIVLARGGSLPGAYAEAQAIARRIAEAMPLNHPAPCHCDLLPGNLLQAADRVLLVDWEYAGMGHRAFDLGNVAVNNDFDEPAQERLLTGYYGEPPGPERRAAVRLMRIMSDAREAAWGVIQGVISELDFDFGAYAESHFARLLDAAADPRLEDWLVDAAAA
jgi:thiamine kinase-like enzyme